MASFLSNAISPNSQATTISLSSSSSISTSLLHPWRRVSAFPAKPRRRTFSVQSKIREIFMPALSSTMTEGKIVSWVKSEGDVLTKGESVVVVESDKADMDVETFYDGILAAIVVGEGETASVGAPIGLLAETEDEIADAKAKAAKSSSSSASAAPVAPSPPAAAVSDGPKKTVATPYAKKLAKQHKVDIESVVGTGPFGRITPADIEAAAGITPSKSNVSSSVAAQPASTAAAQPKAAAPSASPIPGSTVVPFTAMQAAVSKNMIDSLSVPTFSVGYPVITDALEALYE